MTYKLKISSKQFNHKISKWDFVQETNKEYSTKGEASKYLKWFKTCYTESYKSTCKDRGVKYSPENIVIVSSIEKV